MGKSITQQKRGKGGPAYTKPSFNFKAQSKIGPSGNATVEGFMNCRAHSTPMAILRHSNKTITLTVAPEGIKQGQILEIESKETKNGNVQALKDIPEGTEIFNIENNPGDGGKFVKSSGTRARVVAKTEKKVTVQLPSKRNKDFNPNCRAFIGIAAAGGRLEKPFYKAGRKYFAMKAKKVYWPKVSGNSMNAVDHPFGGSKSNQKGRPTIAPKHAPPGRKVGMIRPRNTGRKRGKK